MKKIAFILLLCPLFITSCFAEELPDMLGDLSGAWRVQEELSEEEQAITGSLRLDGRYEPSGALHRLWERFTEQSKEQLKQIARASSEVFLLSLLCALAESFCSASEMRTTIDRIGCCAVSVLVSGNLTEMLSKAGEVVNRLSEYAHVILPILFTTAAAGGALGSASASYASACLAMDMFITASQQIILPLIYMFFALSVSQSLYENSILNAAVKTIKWCAVSAMSLLTMAFGAYLSLTGLITGSRDTLTVKTARTLISRSLPIVGSLLSDSSAILLAAASVVKNSLGVFAMMAVCGICIAPVAACSIRFLIYRATAAAVDFLPGAKLPGLIVSFASVFSLMLGLIGCCAAILFMSIVSGIRVVSPL